MDSLSQLKETASSINDNLSFSALIWTLTSVFVVVFKQAGIVTNYSEALPIVILLSWLGGEIYSRVPKKRLIAYCTNCDEIREIPNYLISKLWKWNYCLKCGDELKSKCKNGHHFSVPNIHQDLFEKNSDINQLSCGQCGETILKDQKDKLSYHEYKSLFKRIAKNSDGFNIFPFFTKRELEGTMLFSPTKRHEYLKEQKKLLQDLKGIIKSTGYDVYLNPSLEQIEKDLEETKVPYNRSDDDRETWKLFGFDLEKLERKISDEKYFFSYKSNVKETKDSEK